MHIPQHKPARRELLEHARKPRSIDFRPESVAQSLHHALPIRIVCNLPTHQTPALESAR
jgi:hypothetical protein